MRAFKTVAVALCCVFLLAACSNPASTPTQTPQSDATPTPEPKVEIFSGTGAGMGGDVAVEVGMTNGKIVSVTVTSHNETPGISDPAIEQLPKAIVAKDSAEVDIVSGATLTSEAIIAAVNAALTQAGRTVEEAPSAEAEPNPAAEYPGHEYVLDLYAYWDKIAEDYAPEIRTLTNGVKVQRTPTEYDIYGWMRQSNTISYNTYWLDADNRGCNSCHESLDDLMKNSKYAHPAFWNEPMGVYTTVNQCLICHTYAPGYIAKQFDFGTMIHGIHYRTGTHFSGSCMRCHNMTADGQGTQLWDAVKYDKLLGIIEVENVQGTFDFTQDKVQSMDEVFSYDWMHSYYDNMRHAMGVNGANVTPPQDMFDNWEITIDGKVNNPYTIKLPDLIKEAEAAGAVVTKNSKMVCDWVAIGGGGITNVEITGIPLTWLVEKAGGAQSGVTGATFTRVDEGSFRCAAKDRWNRVFLVYKIGGEYLDGGRGWPVMNWYEGVDAQSNVKQIIGYHITDEEINYDSRIPNGWIDQNGEYQNKPNATILGVPDGMLVKTGQPITFEGYADAFDEKIVAVEFSMDMGKTWTKYELGDTDPLRWVYWYYTFTPETDGSYVLTVRATSESGLVNSINHKVMITAKSDWEG